MKNKIKISKKEKQEIELTKFQSILLLSQALMMMALIISYVMSLFIVELKLLWQIYLILLTIIMAMSNYSISKNKKVSILYLAIGLLFLIGIIIGV